MSTRYIIPEPLTRERLSAFVGLDNLTAQTPLIEIVRKRPFHIRIWVAYNHERDRGTYMAVYYSGLVKRITVYPDGHAEGAVIRPANPRVTNTNKKPRKEVSYARPSKALR